MALMHYKLNVEKETEKHVFFNIVETISNLDERASQLMYEAELRGLITKYCFNGTYRISKCRYPKLLSYIRGVNKLQRFRFRSLKRKNQ
jgi:hypothetical protein